MWHHCAPSFLPQVANVVGSPPASADATRVTIRVPVSKRDKPAEIIVLARIHRWTRMDGVRTVEGG